MELHHLKAFLVIARTGNLTQAAKELFASQPTVSAQLKALEDELGIVLFDRSHRGMKLTQAGKLLRDKAADVCERVCELNALAASLSRETPAVCRVGLNTTAGVLRIPRILATLQETEPRLRLELRQGLSSGILDDINQDKLDAGFFFGTCTLPGLAYKTLAQIDLAIVGPAAFRQKLADVPVTELFLEPWVLPPEDCVFFAKTLQLLGPNNASSLRGVTADDEATMLHLVREKVGLALLPVFMVEDEDEVVILRRTSLQVDLGVAWRRIGEKSAHLTALLSAVTEVFV